MQAKAARATATGVIIETYKSRTPQYMHVPIHVCNPVLFAL